MQMNKNAVVLIALVCAVACSKSPPAGAPVSKAFSAAQPIQAVATTGMIADIVAQVGGKFIRVTGLMGPGVDPHLYKASEGDIQRLSGADIIFYNGLNLEGKMGDIFVKMARTRPTVAVTEDVDQGLLREPPEFLGHYDPHLWFDVTLWAQAVAKVTQALVEFDPAHASIYQKNATTYTAQLNELDAWCRETLATIPKEQRVMVTAHDAFGYFGRAYEVEVIGLQGISTVAEFGIADVQRIVDLLVARKVPAVFVESSIPRRSIEAVVAGAQARGHQVVIGGQLYSDAMGAAGTPDGSYIGMVRANVRTVTEALSGTVAKR